MDVYAYLAIVVWLIFIFMFYKDRSRYRNCLVLFIAILLSLMELSLLSGENTVIFVLMAVLVIILMVPGFLIVNGIVTIRREGAGKTHLLSLLLGIAIAIGELSFIFVIFYLYYITGRGDIQKMLSPRLLILLIGVTLTMIYVSLSFLMFMIYTIFLMIVPIRRDFDYIIIHGAGLTDGLRPTRLLADRLDKAIKIYHKDPTAPYLIPSGGQGSDEKVSEAQAMKDYLLEKGIPEDHILPEDRSATTYENLINSKKIIDERPGRRYTALVTSNYHVYRCLRYCRKIGLKCTGIGSRVAFYYYPSALIREYIAVHAEKKHALIFLIGWLLFMAPLFAVLFSS